MQTGTGLEIRQEGKLAFAREEILGAVVSQSSVSLEGTYLCPKNRPDTCELMVLKVCWRVPGWLS